MRADVTWEDWRPWVIEEVPLFEEIRFKDQSEDYGFIIGRRSRDNSLIVLWNKPHATVSVTNCEQLFDLCLVRRSDLGEYLPCGALLHRPIVHSHCNPPEP